MALFLAVVIGLSVVARGFLGRFLLGVLGGIGVLTFLIWTAPWLAQGITAIIR